MTGKRKQGHRVYGNQRKRRTAQWSTFLDDPNDKMVHSPSSQSNPTLAPPPAQKRPLSQKEATMPTAPRDSDVETVVEFTNCSRSLAIRYLKVKNNNTEAAAAAILDGEDIDKLERETTWDDSMFSSDRDGNEVGLHPLGTSPAPTRGPSPAPSLGLSQPKSRMQEDKDLEAAIALSRQGHDMPYQQETGVRLQDGTETGQKFGPATREHYERDQWAMVPTSTATHEVVPDTPIEHRRNLAHEPRFLKHLPDGDYTPNFITICQAIPAAREAFLLRDSLRDDYGEDSDWWRGHPIPIPRIVHTVDGTPSQPDASAQEELIAETQRLMAFLDSGTRSYATIGGLTQTEAIKNGELTSPDVGSLLELFIKRWTTAAHARSQHADDVAHLFTTRVGTDPPGGPTPPELHVVDLNVATKEGEKVDLSQLLDDLLWPTDPDEQDWPDNYIERPAEIIVMRLSHIEAEATQLGVEIPAAIQLDKYLQQNVATTRGIRQDISQEKRTIREMSRIFDKLMNCPHPTQQGDFGAGGDSGTVSSDKTRPPHYAGTARQLEALSQRIAEKLQQLENETKRIRKNVAEISKTTFAELGLNQPAHRYTLRGVATKPNITYVLRPKEEHDSEEMHVQLDDDSSTPPDMQWWRLDYEVAGSNARIIKCDAADYDVLRAVELEHRSALLVYASEAACSRDLYEPLPAPLHDFVRRDNDLFLADLHASERRAPASPPAYEFSDVRRQSMERKSSIDSTRVEAGTDSPVPPPSPPGYGDDAFESHHGFGLGYDVKHIEHAHGHGDDDAPVAEINLSPRRDGTEEEDRDLLGDTQSGEMEMMQKTHAPLFPAHADTRMSGTESQDDGTRGAVGDGDVDMK